MNILLQLRAASVLGALILNDVINAHLPYDCPSPEDIYPCYCDDDDGDPLVHCNHLTSLKEVKQGLSGLKQHKIWKISFWMNTVSRFESDILSGVSVQRVVFENSTVQMGSPQFQGLENSLENLQFTKCFSESNPLGSWSLGHLNKLKELVIERNTIRRLNGDWLTSTPPSLRTVTLDGNGIEELDSEAFAKILHLTFLFLEENELSSLTRTMFPAPANDLRSINLNYNNLESLPADIFEEMPNLRSVDLEHNKLTTLEESSWSFVIGQLIKLMLIGNPLECDQSLKWIYEGKIPRTFEGKCRGPKHLEKRSLDSLSLEDFS